jgi:uncharacterized membrane protein
MKTSLLITGSLVITLLSSCAVAGGIFKAGVWVGIFAVVAVIALLIFLVTRGSNKN